MELINSIIYMLIEKITKDFTPALRAMQVGETLCFPLKNYSSNTGVFIPRLRKEMWREKADWERSGDCDYENGIFKITRIS